MIEPGSGILLISDPFLKDPNFMRTVVFLCEHQEQGSFGFVLNRKYENTIDELIPELEAIRSRYFMEDLCKWIQFIFCINIPTQ
jgi:putative transcriptional regulator